MADTEHSHHHVSAHNPRAGQGAVVLDIGGDVGALVLLTRPDMVGREIEISPLGEDTYRRHVEVLPRPTVAGMRYAAVYGGLREGHWTLWGDDDVPVLVVSVRGGEVTEADWPGPPLAGG